MQLVFEPLSTLARRAAEYTLLTKALTNWPHRHPSRSQWSLPAREHGQLRTLGLGIWYIYIYIFDKKCTCTCCIPPPALLSPLCWGSSASRRPCTRSPETPGPIWSGSASVFLNPARLRPRASLTLSPRSARCGWILGKKTGPDPDCPSHWSPEHGQTLWK